VPCALEVTKPEHPKAIQIKARAQSLKAQSKADLIQTVKRNYRVIDTREMDKTSAINHILQAEFGDKTLKEHYYK